MRLRSPRRADGLRALLISCSLPGSLAAGGCIVALGQLSGDAEPSDLATGTGTTTAAGEGGTTTTTTSAVDEGGRAASSAEGGAASNADDAGDAPHFDLGGDRDGSSESSSTSTTAADVPDPDPPPVNDGDCCVPGEGTGCADVVVSACVCADDAYCCDTAWDELCVAEVTNLGCGACGGVQPAGLDVADGCCSAHETGGCSDEAIADCVCASDPYCCTIAWDDVCVGYIAELGCGACDGGTSSGTDTN